MGKKVDTTEERKKLVMSYVNPSNAIPGSQVFIDGKEWRPDDYENPYYAVPSEDDRAIDRHQQTDRYFIYETAYDAAIKALRKQALMYRHGDADSFTSNRGAINFDEGDRGHLVFIPEV